MMTQKRTRNTIIIEMQRSELGHTLPVAVITKNTEKNIRKTKLGTRT